MSLERALEMIDFDIKTVTELNQKLGIAKFSASNRDQRIGTELLIAQNKMMIDSLTSIRTELLKED